MKTRSGSSFILSLLIALFATLLVAAIPTTAMAQAEPAARPSPQPLGPIQSPLWMRYPAISPDGQQIAFAFEGNLFIVPAEGGNARLLVGNGHHSFHPVWSPDGRSIAYASDMYGNFDVFLVADDRVLAALRRHRLR